jgi:hypothetical protein
MATVNAAKVRFSTGLWLCRLNVKLESMFRFNFATNTFSLLGEPNLVFQSTDIPFGLLMVRKDV